MEKEYKLQSYQIQNPKKIPTPNSKISSFIKTSEKWICILITYESPNPFLLTPPSLNQLSIWDFGFSVFL